MHVLQSCTGSAWHCNTTLLRLHIRLFVQSAEPLCSGVREDFTTNCYLWTGRITEEIYDANCSFTDPTISFKGLATFKRNLASLRPVVDRLLSETDVQLLSCELRREEQMVVATWRMQGTFVFPWKPQLDIQGRTEFTYSPDAGNRVVAYNESWNVPAAQALLQLVRPGRRKAP
jgi:hypothetical protein